MRRTRAYGTPEELKALIDAAHGLGLMVFLDVVYNHFGPDGNYLHAYAQQFFRDDIHTPWGAAIDFRRPRGARLLHPERALLARGIPLRRAALRRGARDLASRTCSTSSRPTLRARRAGPPRPSGARERRQRGAATCGRGCSTRSGTTTAIMPARAADRRARGLLRGLPGRRRRQLARVHGRGFAYQGDRRIRGKPRGEPSARPAADRVRDASCRTTTRSATARSASG